MIRYEWPPAWQKELELKAEHLDGLEDYVLSRSQILDEGAYGVDSVPDWRKSIRIELMPQSLSVQVRDLKGVTPGGQPVWLREEDELSGKWSWDWGQKPDFSPGDMIDLLIVFNQPGRAEKLVLKTSKAEDPKVPHPEWIPEALYLGRFLLPHPPNQDAELERHPMVRRLGGFGPVVSDEWRGWVKPLREKLSELFLSYSTTADRSPATYALNAELLRLNYEWPFLPIPTLARRLRLIGWLMTREENSAPDFLSATHPLPDGELSGEELPRRLTALLPQAPQRVTGLGQSLRHLIDLLAQFPVDFHAPIGLLSHWQKELSGLQSRRLPGPEEADLAGLVQTALMRDDWSRAVGLITAMIANLPGQDWAGQAAQHLQRLYQLNAQKGAAAGPMAFYWLAQAAELRPGFPEAASPELSDYFARMRDAPSRDNAPADRLRRYLQRIIGANAAEAAIRAQVLWRSTTTQNLSSTIRIVIAGSKGSGKTATIKALLMAGAPSSTTSIGAGAATETAGRMATAEGNRAAQIIEVDISPPSCQRGQLGAELDSVRDSLARPDLLILTVDPSETYAWRLDALREFALWTLKERPGTIIAIAYTKADEYGVVEANGVRLAEGSAADQLLKAQGARRPEEEFENFAKGRVETRTPEQKKGGLKFFGTQTESGESTATRTHVLKGTQQLWLALLARKDVLLNGYFVSAVPFDKYIGSAGARTGIPQLIADFVECLKGGA